MLSAISRCASKNARRRDCSTSTNSAPSATQRTWRSFACRRLIRTVSAIPRNTVNSPSNKFTTCWEEAVSLLRCDMTRFCRFKFTYFETNIIHLTNEEEPLFTSGMLVCCNAQNRREDRDFITRMV